MTTMSETHQFEAEVQEVLSLVVHSLYSNREIFLRELISNASDALDRLRFEALTDADLLPSDEELGIALEVEREARTLSIADNGIGMTHEELVSNLGTIASSGTRRFMEQLAARGDDERPEMIGQFGVGFYSAFMVADEVTVETRPAGSEQGWRWISSGGGEYTLEPVEGLARGTLVRLHLREGEKQDAFLDPRRIRAVVERYSDFVEYPIQMEVERLEPKLDGEGQPVEGAEPESVVEVQTLNSMKPLWSRPKADISAEEHKEFYRHLSHDWNDPLESIHFRAEGKLEFTALLYLPKTRPFDLFDPTANQSSVSLYVRRVLIMRECEDLLPAWLRFVRGVVESNDLPLNIARETLQDDPRVGRIQRRLVHKVLETLKGIREEERERYEEFWRAFGAVLKEGVFLGADEDQRISSLCLFESSAGPALTSLSEYVERMPEGQEAIYTIIGAERVLVEGSPHIEALKAKGYEILFLTDPVDEWMLQRLPEFDGKPLKAVEKGEIDLEDEDQKKAREQRQEAHKELLGTIAGALSEQVKQVRFSSRLKDSPAVLVSEAGGMSARMEAVLRRSGQDVPPQKRILELNADHPVIAGMQRLCEVDASSPRLGELAELLYGQALIAEGAGLPDPARFSKLLAGLMLGSVQT